MKRITPKDFYLDLPCSDKKKLYYKLNMTEQDGKTLQHSVLGKVKAKLMQKPNTVVLGKTVPTTKLCTKCGQWHDEIRVWNRLFKCDCGVEMDRDIHASQNMVWFYKNNVGVERTKLKRVEMESLVANAIYSTNN